MGNGITFRVQKTKNYTTMSNQHFHVKNMSLQAKGLLSTLLSLPPTWEYSINGFASLCNNSRPTVKKTLEELEELGYLEIKKHAPKSVADGGTGKFTYEYIIYECSKHPEKLILNSDK